MTDIRIDVDYGPPVIPHRIRGRRNADLPVGGINVLVHRHVRLTDWRMIEAITKQWVLYWPTRGRGRVVHQNDAHDLSSGTAYLMLPHTTFSSDCKPDSSGGVTLHDLAVATSPTERSLSELVHRTTTPAAFRREATA